MLEKRSLINQTSSISNVVGPVGGRERRVLQELVDREVRIYGPGHDVLTHRGERRAEDSTRGLRRGSECVHDDKLLFSDSASPAFYTRPTSPNRLRISHAKNLDLGGANPGSLGDRGDEGVALGGQLILRERQHHLAGRREVVRALVPVVAAAVMSRDGARR